MRGREEEKREEEGGKEEGGREEGEKERDVGEKREEMRENKVNLWEKIHIIATMNVIPKLTLKKSPSKK